MAATQMNFRIQAEMKAAGDSTLRDCGVTPAEIVRSTWAYLARNRHVKGAVEKLIGFLESDGDANTGAQREEAAYEVEALASTGPAIVARFLDELDVPMCTMQEIPYDELKLAAYAEKYPYLEERA